MKYRAAVLLAAAVFACTAAVKAEFDGYIVSFPDESRADAAMEYMEKNAIVDENMYRLTDRGFLYHFSDEALIKTFDELGLIEYYEENEIIVPDFGEEMPKEVPNLASLFASASHYQWSHELCHTKTAWKLGVTGKGTTLLVIDSGVQAAHEDLAGAVLGGKDYNSTSDEATTPADYSPRTIFNPGNREYYHGTMVTGFAMARYNGFGVTGVAPDASVYMARCINDGGGVPIAKAAVAISEAGQLGADVINMSFGKEGRDRGLDDAVSWAVEDGVILAAAAGNNYNGTEIQYPASCDGAISVAACGSGGTWSGYTRNLYVCITAPGVSVWSTKASPESTSLYSSGSGTSYSSPFVAGAALLAKSVDKSITPAHFKELLTQTADKSVLKGARRTDKFGYGIIDVGALITALLNEKYDKLYVGPLFHDYDDGSDSVTLLNTTDEPMRFDAVIAAYDAGGKMTGTVAGKVDCDPGELAEFDVTPLDVPGKTVKLFTFKDMRPCAAPYILQ